MISQEAIEAARNAMRVEAANPHRWGKKDEAVALAALEAAAPFLRAQALEEAADERYKDGLFVFGLAARQKLRARAATERGQGS